MSHDRTRWDESAVWPCGATTVVGSVFACQAAELKQADHDEVRGSLDLVMAASMAMKLGVEASPEETLAADRFLAFTQQHGHIFLQLGK